MLEMVDSTVATLLQVQFENTFFYCICWLICKTYIKRMLHRT